MFANLMFRGMVLLAISMVGEYIGRMYLSFSRDPQFVVRERLPARKKTADQVVYSEGDDKNDHQGPYSESGAMLPRRNTGADAGRAR
jgi:hypothetical protein